MFQRLPSLTALRVFVAVARHGGVSRAAEALHLTHSAVSHQIRALQEELGVTLFEKDGRGLRLAADAGDFAARVEAAFQSIEDAAQDFTTGKHKRLRISTIPSFAACWLMPRLGGFIATCQDVDVDVQSTERKADIKGGEVDVGLRFGVGPHPGLFAELLMHDWLFPVCSPEFARQYALGDHAGIDGVPLMHSSCEPWSWWFAAAGITAEEPARGVMFDDSSLMLQAAMAGQGLCLGRQSLVHDYVAAGKLVRPFTAAAESPHSYYFVCRKEKLETAPVASFRQWITREVASFPALDLIPSS